MNTLIHNTLLPNVAELLAEQGLLLLAAATLLLCLGCAVMLLYRSPGHRQRVGEASIAAVLAFLLLTVLPLPRTQLGGWLNQNDTADEAIAAADDVTPNTQRMTTALANEYPQPWQTTLAENVAENDADTSPAARHDLPTFAPVTDEHIARVPLFDKTPQGMDRNNAQNNAQNADLEATRFAPTPPLDTATGANADNTAPSLAAHNIAQNQAQHAAIQQDNRDLLTAAGPVPDTTPPEKLESGTSTPVVLAWCYLAGTLACCLWLLLGRLQLWRITRRAKPANAAVTALVHDSLANAHRVRVLTTTRIARPITFGLWRPTILLPAGLVRTASAESLSHVLRHECAHINRRDALGQMICNLALPLLWLHPLYWLIRHRTRLDAELVADDWAAGQSSPAEYVEQLVHLVRRGRGTRLAAVGVMGLFSSQSQFARRMEMLMQRTTRLSTRTSRGWKGALLIAVCGLAVLAADAVGGSRAAAQRTDDQVLERLNQLQTVVADLQAQTEVAMQRAKEQQSRADAAEARAAHLEEMLNDLMVKRETERVKADHDKDLQLRKQETQFDDMAVVAQHTRAQLEEAMEKYNTLRQENAVLRDELMRADPQHAGPPKPGTDDPVKSSQPKPGTDPRMDPFAANKNTDDNPFADTNTASDPFAANKASENPFANERPGSRSVNVDNSRGAAADIDLLSLATAMADGHGELRKAEIRLTHLSKASENGAVPASEVEIAQIDLETQKRKLELYRSLAEAALQSAQLSLETLHAQLEHATRLAKAGFVTQEEIRLTELQLHRAEANLQIIKRVLSQ